MSAVRLSSVAAAAVLVTVSLARPRPCAAQMQYTGAARNVTLKMTVPDGVTKIRGVFAFTVRGLASGWAGSAAFKDLAKRLDSVIVTVSGGDDLNDNSYPNRCASGEFNGIGEALDKLAMASNHPELSHAPVVGLGHSHGGDYWNWYNACHPERMAAVFVHASGGVNYSGASLKVPVFYTLGTGDLIENGSKKPRAGMWANRAKGAPMTMVIAMGGHDTQFTAEEYQQKPHWGHSTPDDAIAIAREADVKTLALYHHAPHRSDDQQDAILEHYRTMLRGQRLQLVAAYEGLELPVGGAA